MHSGLWYSSSKKRLLPSLEVDRGLFIRTVDVIRELLSSVFGINRGIVFGERKKKKRKKENGRDK